MGAWSSVSPLPEEELVAQIAQDELTTASIPHPTVSLGEGERQNGKLSSGRREVGGKVFLYFHYPTLIWQTLSLLGQ